MVLPIRGCRDVTTAPGSLVAKGFGSEVVRVLLAITLAEREGV